ncbi:MAG: hypothetical protein SH850_18785 [Planctomycetaceae bacterium]|nr:hypothetical protein [Planctomycetaceae bacterium]
MLSRAVSFVAVAIALCLLLSHGIAADQSAVDERLQRKVTVNVNGVPIKTAIEELARKHNLQVAWTDGRNTRQRQSMSTSLSVAEIRLQSALQLLCQSCGLQYAVEDGCLHVVSHGDDAPLIQRHYPLDDLRPLQPTPFQVANCIQQTATGEWEKIDGIGGTLVNGETGITILQTRAVHAEIAEMLVQLAAHAKGRPQPPSPIEQANERVLIALTKPVRLTDKNWSVRETFERVAVASECQVVIDLTALENKGIVLDQEKVPLTGQTEPTSAVLDRLCKEHKLRWFVADEVLQVTTNTKPDVWLTTRVYNVAPLLTPKFDLPALMKQLEETEEWGPWENINGVGGALFPVGPLLVVRQSRAVHRQLAKRFEVGP